MRIQVRTDGGIAAIPGLQRPISVDVDELPDELGTELRRLLEEADFFHLPEQSPAPPGAADYRMHTIAVVDDDRAHTVRFPEMNTPQAIGQLLDRLQALR